MEALSLCIIAPRDPPQNQASSITDKIKSKLDKDNSIISCSANPEEKHHKREGGYERK